MDGHTILIDRRRRGYPLRRTTGIASVHCTIRSLMEYAMAEGLFRLRQLTTLPFPPSVLRSVVRIHTGRMLEYRLYSTQQEATD